LPPSITELDVTEINVPGAPVEQEPEPIDPGVPFALDLDVDINIPNQAYLRGRGLDSEWQGKLHVTGTADAPRIVGELSPRRGTFSFADKNFDITDSRIVFDGSPEIDPRLDISAVNDAGDLTAIIRVTGRASDPEIAITSRPPLPQDEIMSRLLFGRKAGQLSAVEAFQLAQALRSLTGEGGGGGIVDIVRQTIGVDVLSVGSDAEGGATLEVGQYLTEGVRVGVEQRFETGSTAATVEIELTDEISVETEIGGEASKVGISWGYDY
jgi:translocation and assembly module TamB